MNNRLVSLLAIVVFGALVWVETRIGLEFLLPITILAIIVMVAVFFIDNSERKEREHPTTNH